MDPTKKLDDVEHALVSYLGGKLSEGDVPHGPRLIPPELQPLIAARLADKGFAVTFAPGAESALTVATIRHAPPAHLEG